MKLKFTILFLFSENPVYENHPTLDSYTRPFTRQDGFQSRRIKRSVVYDSKKIEFLIFQNNRVGVFFASFFFFSPVQIKYRMFCKFRVLRVFVIFRQSAIPCNFYCGSLQGWQGSTHVT